MTAVNMVKFDQDVLIYADTAAYDAHGIMRGHLQKTTILFPQKALVAARGPNQTAGLYRMHAAHRWDFDDIVQGMASDLFDAVRIGFNLGEPSCVTVDVAGWSKSAGEFQLYEMWAIGPTPDELDGQSLELHRYRSIFTAPPINPSKLAGSGLIDGNGAMKCDDLDAAMIQLMQLQRSTNYRIGPTSDYRGCMVGGAIQKTHLNLAGASTAIIHEWPDALGEPVGGEVSDRDYYYFPSELTPAPR